MFNTSGNDEDFFMVYKQKKLIITLVSVILILSFACLASLIYNFMGGFYKNRVVKYSKILGETQTIAITGEGVFCAACNFSGVVLLDDDISQKIYIKTQNITQDLNLKAKIILPDFQGVKCDMFGFTNWVTESGDDYVYFNQKVGSNEQVGLCKYIRLNNQLKLESNLDYVLIFVVEAYAA